MTSSALATSPAATRTERYRRAEQALWEHYGLQPTERFIELREPRARIRVVEVGNGEPVLFVPGTGGTGPSWGALVRELPGFRCLMVDRPGWGLSAPIDFSRHEHRKVVADVLRAVLDAIGLERAHVVGASIGDLWALRLAAAHPARVDRIALLGGGPIASDIVPPPFIRLLASPIGAIIVRLPQKADRVRSILRQLGHGASLDAGRIPDEYVGWRVAFDRDTDSMRNERSMVRAALRGRGWRPGFVPADAELAQIRQPTMMVYGTEDPVGSEEIWSRAMATMPAGTLRVVPDGGHLPWLDDPARVGADVRAFLGGRPTGSGGAA